MSERPKAMNKTTITVYDYTTADAVRSATVDAYCVGGIDGVYAVYPHPTDPNCVALAVGDDGHWWFVQSFHKAWFASLAEAFQNISKDIALKIKDQL